ncbi:MAG: hypothetical protein LBL52_03390 [Rickettsiales bacterium]|nr:hypothetical protein [Rickettsiales bacterium]
MKKFLLLGMFAVLSLVAVGTGIIAQNRDLDAARAARKTRASSDSSTRARSASESRESRGARTERQGRASRNSDSAEQSGGTRSNRAASSSKGRRTRSASGTGTRSRTRGTATDSKPTATRGSSGTSARAAGVPQGRITRSSGWGVSPDSAYGGDNGVVKDVWSRRDQASTRGEGRTNRGSREEGGSSRTTPFERGYNEDGTERTRRGGSGEQQLTGCDRGYVMINNGTEAFCGRCSSDANYDVVTQKCTCRTGFSGDGLTCAHEVNPNSCSEFAEYDIFTGRCVCKPGYGGDGTSCSKCSEFAGINVETHQCVCKAGFFGDGVNCTSNCPKGFIANTSAGRCDSVCPDGYRIHFN